MTDSLDRFLELSPCPFAQRATVSAGDPWRDPLPHSARLDQMGQRMHEFVGKRDSQLLALEIHGARRCDSVLAAAALIRALLTGLRARDATRSAKLETGIDDPDWDFEFASEAFFVSFFGPFYPASHSRFSGFEDVAFVLFQPERAFRQFGISSQRPGRATVSQKIHQRFHHHGQDYDLALNLHAAKALRYVKPVAAGDPPVPWWNPPKRSTPSDRAAASSPDETPCMPPNPRRDGSSLAARPARLNAQPDKPH